MALLFAGGDVETTLPSSVSGTPHSTPPPHPHHCENDTNLLLLLPVNQPIQAPMFLINALTVVLRVDAWAMFL